MFELREEESCQGAERSPLYDWLIAALATQDTPFPNEILLLHNHQDFHMIVDCDLIANTAVGGFEGS
jgi:hypothetical protein